MKDEILAAMRVEFSSKGLSREQLRDNPFDQFALWFEQACQAELAQANAMSLATATAAGKPSLRTVLLKHFDARGFVFFTNFESRKAREIAENKSVALLFPWLALERQVVITGVAEKIPATETLKYFVQRPLESQFSAWASPQSRVIESKRFLEAKVEEIKRKFTDGKVPLPSFWGGFRIVPHVFEFWQGGGHRLHDRFLYTQEPGSWRIERLAP